MQPAKILVELRRVLPPADAPFVLAALSEDNLVWKSLQDQEFLNSILSEESCIASSWSPASIALRPLGSRVSFTELTAEHIPGIEVSLRKQSLELLENTLRSGQPPNTLTQAGLLALGMRERRRKTNSWQGFLSELMSVPANTRSDLVEVWKTPLACLYGIIPDKWDLLESLLPQESMHPSIEWISHIILSNPIDPEAQTVLFHDLMSQLVVEYQVEWLRYLIGKGRFALAAGIADQLLTTGKEFLNRLEADFSPDHAEWVTVSRKVLDNQLAATLYQISGRPLQAGIYLDKTRNLLQHWLVGSSLQMVNVIDREGDVDEAVYNEVAELMTQLPVSEQLKNEALFLGGSEILSKRLYGTSSNNHSPIAHLSQVVTKSIAIDSQETREKTRAVIRDLLDQLNSDPNLLKGQFVFDRNPKNWLDSLTEQGLEVEAIDLAERFLEVRAEDTALMNWLADTCHQLGEDEKALDYRNRLILLEPEELNHLRKLANLYEDRQEWVSALEELQKVVQASQNPLVDDQLALASCAIDAQNYGEAFVTCEKILEEDPENGMAFALLGKGCLAQGDIEKGITHLKKAVMLVPESHTPWFALAEAYRRKGDNQKELETLREAVLTAPDSAELHYALGKAYLDSTQISDALPFLRQSARLAPESVDISQALAEALITLGYKQEALEVVEKARTRWRVHPGLAYLHAKMLLKEGHDEKGLDILEIALQSENPKAEWYVLSAQTLIGDTEEYLTGGEIIVNKDRLGRALSSLQKAVGLQPHSFQARLLTAEALLLRGDHEQAFDVYRNLIELPEAVQDEWYWRMQAGLGRSALNLGQTETALASLQNAVTANPTSIGLLRFLADAYCAANLADSAAGTAEQALSLAPDQVENLAWYAELMARIQQTDKAIEALRKALDLKPESVDLVLKLAEIHLIFGDEESARVELSSAIENPAADSSQLRQAAHTYLKIEENLKALSAMEKAVDINGQADDRLLFELAVLYKTAGKNDQALETIEKALKAQPNLVDYHIFQAELLEKSNRSQAALGSLKKGLQLTESTASEELVISDSRKFPQGIFQIASTPIEIHILITQLQQKMGNLEDALTHAEKALELQPNSTELRFIGAEMAAKLLLNDKAVRLIGLELDEAEKIAGDVTTHGNDPWKAGLYSLQAEFALDSGDNQAASRSITEGIKVDPTNTRLAAAKVILLARTGDWAEAGQLFNHLWSQVEPVLKSPTIRSLSDNKKISITDGTLLTIAEAGVELYRWSEAIQLVEHVVRRQPSQPLALLRQVKTVVRAAEWYFTGSRLGSVIHLPDEYVTSEAAYTQFSQGVNELKKLSDSPEIDRWKVRGEIVFHPSTESIRGFTARSLTMEDAASLVMALNRVGNSDGAYQIGEQYNSHAMVCVQISLVDAKNASDINQEAALRAVSLMPNHPICHAALGAAAEKNGDVGRALEAVETALIFWPTESGWQYMAAKLALRSSEIEAARIHLEKTHNLMPANLDIALELGAVYQMQGDGANAVKVLQKAVQISPVNSAAWLAFAHALNLNKQTDDALKAAAQAAAHGESESFKALVLSGEIYLASGEEKKAMEYAREAEKLAPAQPETRLLITRILAARGKEKDALIEINRAISELPGVLELELERGRLVNKVHGPEAALQVLQPLAEQNPENDQVVGVYASVLAEADRMEDAEKAALQTLRINPKNSGIHLLLGRIYTSSGQLDKAVHHLSESAKLSSGQIEAYLDLGTVYSQRRDFADALNAYQQAMTISPDDFRPYYQAGLILRDSKDYPAAENMLRRAAALAPQDVNIRRQLGAIVALNLVHNCQEASSCL